MSPAFRPRILFVDDDAVVLRAIARILGPDETRWAMTFVLGGRAGMTALETSTFELLVTDLEMPEVDGRMLLAAVRAQWPKMGCIVLTGATFDPRSVAADQVLVKPANRDVLRAAIDSVIVSTEP